jgi:uncharacterized radical SAM superfamily protein
MKQITPESIYSMDDNEFSAFLDKNSLSPISKHLRFYAPSFTYYKTAHYCSSSTDFPTVSITGKSCALNCKHCGGTVLETMHHAKSSEELFELCKELKTDGAKGCLISGGCLPTGSVPIETFIDGIARVKAELNLTILVHTGIVDETSAKNMFRAGVDSALIDIIGSTSTIREICKLQATTKDYSNSLFALSKSGISFVPHVIVGLHYGRLEGEYSALKMIRQVQPSALVIIAFMPLRRTEMEKVSPPRSLDVARTLATARLMFPEVPIALGCMRPHSEDRAEIDKLAIKAGVDAVAFPTEEAVEYAKHQGFRVSFSPHCCSQVYVDLRNTPV